MRFSCRADVEAKRAPLLPAALAILLALLAGLILAQPQSALADDNNLVGATTPGSLQAQSTDGYTYEADVSWRETPYQAGVRQVPGIQTITRCKKDDYGNYLQVVPVSGYQVKYYRCTEGGGIGEDLTESTTSPCEPGTYALHVVLDEEVIWSTKFEIVSATDLAKANVEMPFVYVSGSGSGEGGSGEGGSGGEPGGSEPSVTVTPADPTFRLVLLDEEVPADKYSIKAFKQGSADPVNQFDEPGDYTVTFFPSDSTYQNSKQVSFHVFGSGDALSNGVVSSIMGLQADGKLLSVATVTDSEFDLGVTVNYGYENQTYFLSDDFYGLTYQKGTWNSGAQGYDWENVNGALTKAGVYKALLTGAGVFTGLISNYYSFTLINPAALEDCEVHASDISPSELTGGKSPISVELRDAQGGTEAYTEDFDYSVVYKKADGPDANAEVDRNDLQAGSKYYAVVSGLADTGGRCSGSATTDAFYVKAGTPVEVAVQGKYMGSAVPQSKAQDCLNDLYVTCSNSGGSFSLNAGEYEWSFYRKGNPSVLVTSLESLPIGSYFLKVSCKKEGYVGSAYASVDVVNGKSLVISDYEVQTLFCTGNPLVPQVTFTLSDGTTVTNDDVTLSNFEKRTEANSGNPYDPDIWVAIGDDKVIDAGQYRATATGNGTSCFDEKQFTFSVNPSISLASCKFDSSQKFIAGQAYAFGITYTGADSYGNYEIDLVQNTHYTIQEIRDNNGQGVGTQYPQTAGVYHAYLEAVPASGFTGSLDFEFVVYGDKDLAGATVTMEGYGADGWWAAVEDSETVTVPQVNVKMGSAVVPNNAYRVVFTKDGTGEQERGSVKGYGIWSVSVVPVVGEGYTGEGTCPTMLRIPHKHALDHIAFDANASEYDYEHVYQVVHTGSPVNLPMRVYARDGAEVERAGYTITYYSRSEDPLGGYRYTELSGPPTEVGHYSIAAFASAGSKYSGATDKTHFDIKNPVPDPDSGGSGNSSSGENTSGNGGNGGNGGSGGNGGNGGENGNNGNGNGQPANNQPVNTQPANGSSANNQSTSIQTSASKTTTKTSTSQTAKASTAKSTSTTKKAAKGIANGKTAVVGGMTYKVVSNAKATVTFQKAAKKKKAVTVPAIVKIKGKTYSVVGIAAKAFKGTAAQTVTVKTKRLTAKSVKNCFSGAKKVKTVKVNVGNKKTNKTYVNKYKNFFTKKICGKKVKVK